MTKKKKEKLVKAVKFDVGKLRFDLIPPDAMRAVADIFTYGTRKYDDRNWEKGDLKWGQLKGAHDRHMNSFWSGEDLDPESGKPHIAHATWNDIALLAYYLRGCGIDDRFILQEKKNGSDKS